MKNPRFEQFGRMQRQYHRHHPWRLSQGGLFIPHSYAETKPDSLSWWDDVGFILNGRRIIVWWRHPRHVYSDAIEDLSLKEAGESPGADWLFDGCTTNYKRVGKSRKKIVSHHPCSTGHDDRCPRQSSRRDPGYRLSPTKSALP